MRILMPIKEKLNFMNLLMFFPYNLKVNDQELVMTKFEWFKIAMYTNIACFTWYICLILYLVEPYFKTFKLEALHDASDTSLLDSVAKLTIPLVSVCGGVVHIIMYAKKAKGFTKLCKEMETFPINDKDIIQVYKATVRKLKIMSLLCLMGSLLNTIYFHFTLKHLFHGFELKYPFLVEIFKVVTFFNWQMTFYSGAHISANFLILFFIGLCLKLCNDLITKMEEEHKVHWTMGVNKLANLQSYFQQANFICHFISKLNNVLEPFILIQCALGLSLSFGAAFNVSGILFSAWSSVRICFTISNIFYLTLFIMNLFYIFYAGQELEDKVEEVKDNLQRLGEDPQVRLNQTEKRQFYGIMNKLGGSITQLSPYSYFSVNNSTFLATVGVIITYLIVLMQFKSTE